MRINNVKKYYEVLKIILNSNWYPIVELDIPTDTQFFDLSKDKSKTRERSNKII